MNRPFSPETSSCSTGVYTTRSLRRQDRAMTEQDARLLLRGATHAVLCMENIEGGGYGIPINYAWDEEDSIYFHCAASGHKLSCLQNNPRVSLVVLKAPCVLGEQFSMAYESVIVQGNVDIVNSSEEKRKALALLIQRITPQHIERGEQYINRAVDVTTVLRLKISEFSGKSHASH